MNHQSENSKKLNKFFNEEYASLKTYVSSNLKASINKDAEDIIQDVALKLFAGADRYSPINNVAGFVYRAIKNKVIDVMRTSKNNRIDYETQNENKLIEFASIIYESADNSYPEPMKEALKTAIINLKPDYRNIILAIDFEGYTYKELTNKTGIPVGTLMSRRHRAISQLYKILKKEINN
ncbi:RNA polymerase subunit sigma-24 [Seonamhaeicola sp. S2-3]|uniref:RNA polymerase sigma factor n=1 Tax=Seonamhaeicola sp. S2-3 TaxID=1936081 RepID=UPI000972E360|nr:RNA polymerase sigma factor [Seonamhaeicola sp. S2-3]APY09771.1 RNA polymerase subunit sigma-24 [Seonamhaeicola sp. S2-3]